VTENPSYQAIKSLNDTVYITKEGHKVRFTAVEIPVGYDDVDNVVPGFHDGGKYNFIVHLGVGLDGMVKFEQVAHSGGYKGKDIHGKTGPLEGNKSLRTTWDVYYLVDQIRQMGYEVLLCALGY
jgi:hypothetical protein